MGHEAKWEYFQAVYGRYRKAGREAKQGWLDTVSTTQQQLSKVEKRIKPLSIDGKRNYRRVTFTPPLLVRSSRSPPPAALDWRESAQARRARHPA